MIGFLREMPDWAIGGVSATALWFGSVYTVLTPRVIEAEAQESLLPSCKASLQSEQDRALEKYAKSAEEDRASKLDSAHRALRARERELSDYQHAKAAYDKAMRIMRETGLDMFLPDTSGLLTAEELKSLRAEIDIAKRKLANLPPIEIPKMPDSEIAKLCGCAALQTMAGKKSDYTIWLASFRLISPEAISSAKSDMASALRFKGCGEKTWENLS